MGNVFGSDTPLGGGSGEVNTGTNLGNGNGVFAQKVSGVLQFKSLVAGSGVTLTPSGTEILITSTGGGGSSLDQQQIIYVSKAGNDSNSGLNQSEPKLTIGSAITAVGTPTALAPYAIKILDGGVYDENITIPVYTYLDGSSAELTGTVSLTDDTSKAQYKVDDDIQYANLGVRIDGTLDADEAITVTNMSAATVFAVTGEGNLTILGTVNGRDVSADGSKLDTIANGAEVNTVNSVNSQTGNITLDADDISDTSTTNKFVTSAEKTKLSGIEEGAEVNLTGPEIKALYEGELDTNAFTDAEKSKLSSIEDNATADQTGAEIKALYELEDDTNAFTNSDKSKLDAIEAGATADQTGAEIKTLYESELDTNAFTDADKTKLDNIESGATADQTPAEIKTAYESNSNTNAFTDAHQTKLTNIEDNATADQTGSEIKALYEAELDTNAFTDAEKSKLAGIEAGATAGGGGSSQTPAEIKTAYESNLDTNAFTDSDKSKLDNIEAGADVNVNADWNAISGDAEILNKPTDLTDLSSHSATELSDVSSVGSGAIITTAERTKLTGIEDGATADQTDAEIKIAYENNADTNAFTDAEKTKLAGIEEGATAGGGGGSSGNPKELIASLDYNGSATTATSTLTWANPTDYETIEFEIFNVKGDWTTGSGSVQFADGSGTLITSGYYTAYNHGNSYNGGGEAYAQNTYGVYYINSQEVVNNIDEMQVYGRVMNAGSSSKSLIVNGYFAGTWTNSAHVIQTKFGAHNRSIIDGITGLRFYTGHSTRKFTQMSIRVYGTKKVVV